MGIGWHNNRPEKHQKSSLNRQKRDYNVCLFFAIKLPMLKEAFSQMPKIFHSTVLIQAQKLYEQDKVLSTRLSDGLLRGRVKGPSNQIYDVYMDLKNWPQFPAHCTCSWQRNCEHAAACLIYLNNQDLNTFNQKSSANTELNTWLQNMAMQDFEKRQSEETLIYLIQRSALSGESISVELAQAKILKKGGLGKLQKLDIFPTHLTEEDQSILAGLSNHFKKSDKIGLLSIHNSDLLEKILQTNRAYLVESTRMNDMTSIQPLSLGAPCEPVCGWSINQAGEQTFYMNNGKIDIIPLCLDSGWYRLEKGAVLGKLITPYPIQQLHNLFFSNPVKLDEVADVIKAMDKNAPGLPKPRLFSAIKEVSITPKPILAMDVHDKTGLFIATLYFEYGHCRVAEQEIEPFVIDKIDEKTLVKYLRDFQAEAIISQKLRSMIPTRPMTQAERWQAESITSMVLTEIHSEQDISRVHDTYIPSLQAQGFAVELLSPIYQKPCFPEEFEWFSDLEESGNDFFTLQTGILIDGKSVNIVPLIADLISQSKGQDLDARPDAEKISLPLEDGRRLVLEMGRIKPLIRLILQCSTKNSDHQRIQISKYQLMLLQEAEKAMAATEARWHGTQILRKQLQQLIACQDLPQNPPPAGLQTTLRDYQHAGLNWLQFLRVTGFGGILADDMGLGKTVQTLALLQYEKEAGRLNAPSLIIAPTSLMGNWQAEAARFTPDLKVLIFHGLERHEDNFEKYDVIVSTYGLIQRDKARFLQHRFYYLILDEAQFIKNARTKTTQIIQQLQASHRLCLSGTPMENHLGELWSLFHFLMPGLLGDMKQFRQWFRNPIEKYQDEARRAVLVKRVQPFMLRRTKNTVMRELPPKTEMVHTIDLTDKQRDLYEAIRMTMEKKVREAIARQGLGKSHIVLLDALLKLRQICCDPRLLSLPEASIAHGHSAKLDALMELLENLREEGRRVLVFSQFTSMLALIEQALQHKKFSWLKLTGETRNRHQMVETFQQGEVDVFLISLKAGGTGLNLTRADTVIHYDPWWNPAVEEQATDRSHRIGQENPVFVYKLITAGTVEETILKLQGKKRQLVQGILSSERGEKLELTESDIASFFMPLD